ncbi:MAG: sigma-70 family RNA polymerase sigma factor [bacterium]
MTVDNHTEYADDARIIDRINSGDTGAFRLLYDRYHQKIYRTVYRMLNSADDAADVTQDIFVRAFERLNSLKDGQAFQAWLMQLAVNMVRDKLRRFIWPTFSLTTTDDDTEIDMPDNLPGPQQIAENNDLSQHVQQALMKLSPDHRTVIILHHLEGMSLEEIAVILKTPTGTLKSRLARARVQLRDLLKDLI